MVVRAKPAARRQRTPERIYHPDWETDPLLKQYVSRPPWTSGKNDAVIRGLDGGAYPVWSIMHQYYVARGNMDVLMEQYRGALTPDHIAAAVRFTELYPDEILPRVEAIRRAG